MHKGRVQRGMHTQGNLEQFNIILALNKEDLSLVGPQDGQQLLCRTIYKQLQEMPVQLHVATNIVPLDVLQPDCRTTSPADVLHDLVVVCDEHKKAVRSLPLHHVQEAVIRSCVSSHSCGSICFAEDKERSVPFDQSWVQVDLWLINNDCGTLHHCKYSQDEVDGALLACAQPVC